MRFLNMMALTEYVFITVIDFFFFLFQSDIVHQSVYELVHSEDREELQRQLMWNSFLPPESANIVLQDVLQPDNCHLLERSFTVRFRCLLDNTSGFLVSPHSLLSCNSCYCSDGHSNDTISTKTIN